MPVSFTTTPSRLLSGTLLIYIKLCSDILNLFWTQGLGKGAKKQVVTDEWRHGNVEERLEYALVKVKKQYINNAFTGR